MAELGEEESLIIKPPPHMLSICDKTAEFVARVGSQFEARVYSKEKNNPDYSFLFPDNHYFAYYKAKIQEFKEAQEDRKISGAAAPLPPSQGKKRKAADGEDSGQVDDEDADDEEAVKVIELEKPRDAHYVLSIPPLTSALHLARVKLCAQAVAKHGESFRVSLMNNHQEDEVFNFLSPGAPLSKLFEQLIVCYKRVASGEDAELVEQMKTRASALAEVVKKLQWERVEREKKRKHEQEMMLEEQMDMGAAVDWSDFVVVERIDFNESQEQIEVFPPPVPIELIRMARFQRPIVAKPAASAPSEPVPVAAAAPLPAGVSAPVVQNYVPGQNTAPQQQAAMTQQCPVCGQQIPIEQFEAHMRYETMDKRHLAQLEDRAVGRRTAMAPDEEIANQISAMSQQRTDIFDTGEETPEQIAKRRRLEQQEEGKVYWDGRAESADAQINVNEQIRRIHESKGSANVSMHSDPTIGPSAPKQQKVREEELQPVYMKPKPVSKDAPAAEMVHPYMEVIPEAAKASAQKADLVAEQEWLESHQGEVEVQVQVPNEVNSKGWKLGGQLLKLRMPLTSTVSQLKKAIHKQINLPASKQKLHTELAGFFKNGPTLAFYNVSADVPLELAVKTRGGKKN